MEGFVQVPIHTLEDLNISPLEPVLLRSYCNESSKRRTQQPASIILQAVPRIDEYDGNVIQEQKGIRMNAVRLHPFVEEFLVCAAEKYDKMKPICMDMETDIDMDIDMDKINMDGESHNPVLLQYAHRDGGRNGDFHKARIVSRPYVIEKIDPELIYESRYGNRNGTVPSASEGFRFKISLQLMCSTNEENDKILNKTMRDDINDPYSYLLSQVQEGLQCRTIQKGSFITISLPSIQGLSGRKHRSNEMGIFYVVNVETMAKHDVKNDTFYELGPSDDFEVSLVALAPAEEEAFSCGVLEEIEGERLIVTCPGYESLVEEIVEIANINVQRGAPSGVMISGCRGVGKTRLAVAIIGKLAGTNIGSSKIVSAKDIILQASASMDLSSLKKYMSRYLFYCKKADREIIVIDDLDVIFEECDDSSVDYEKRIARHAVIGLVDDLTTNKQKWKQMPFILGISSNGVANLSPDVSKIGRFEKNMVMNPPTEQQRSEILSEMLKHLPISQTDASRSKEECCLSWGSTIARHTSGCVAADLKRMCIDALTRSRARADSHTSNEQDARIEWSDVREAGRQCVPSQLSQLDVTMARNLDEESDNSNTLSPRDAFFQYWNSRFAGHDETKTKIYRSIVWPWKRHEGQGRRVISELERNIPPPSGVLFHGPSGTGKTFAAECLASSLGLNVVRVRASDVLDQWLGGSEAAIRAIFTRARAAAPCILFFDELDAIAMNREDDSEGSNDVHSRLLSTLLNEMDGVNSNKDINDLLIVGTTNRIQSIDAALLRPGRFEEHILIRLPTMLDIESIMQMLLVKVPLDPNLNMHDIAELLAELEASAADVKGICSAACLYAINNVKEGQDLDNVTLKPNDFEEVIGRWKQ